MPASDADIVAVHLRGEHCEQATPHRPATECRVQRRRWRNSEQGTPHSHRVAFHQKTGREPGTYIVPWPRRQSSAILYVYTVLSGGGSLAQFRCPKGFTKICGGATSLPAPDRAWWTVATQLSPANCRAVDGHAAR